MSAARIRRPSWLTRRVEEQAELITYQLRYTHHFVREITQKNPSAIRDGAVCQSRIVAGEEPGRTAIRGLRFGFRFR